MGKIQREGLQGPLTQGNLVAMQGGPWLTNCTCKELPRAFSCLFLTQGQNVKIADYLKKDSNAKENKKHQPKTKELARRRHDVGRDKLQQQQQIITDTDRD